MIWGYKFLRNYCRLVLFVIEYLRIEYCGFTHYC